MGFAVQSDLDLEQALLNSPIRITRFGAHIAELNVDLYSPRITRFGNAKCRKTLKNPGLFTISLEFIGISTHLSTQNRGILMAIGPPYPETSRLT